jgi:glycosyltransferase involved in cell wall biosynthesis
VYPTNSFNRWLRPYSAARLGKKIVFDKNFVRGKSLITAQDPFECGLAGAKVKAKWRIPLVVQLHTDPFSPYFVGFINKLRQRIARSVLQHAYSLRVVTTVLKDQISKKLAFPESKISVLPIYVDVKRIENSRVSFDLHARYGWHFIILSVARLTAEKNLALGLRAFARVRDRFPDTGYVIVGNGTEQGNLKKLAKDLGVEKSVAFVGWQEDLASYYGSSNVFLQTSFFEGYGLALVEAGLSNLPVVTTPVGIAGELRAGEDAYIFLQNDEENLVGLLSDLIEHNVKRDTLKFNLKNTLEAKLISKEEYLKRLKAGWEAVSTHIGL